MLNEEDNIRILYERVLAVMKELKADFELIFIDDGSTDRSIEKIIELHKNDPRVKMLSFSRNFGHQIALTAGMDYATGDAVIMMDADLQHPPELIKDLVQYWNNGYEIVYTTRQSTQDADWLKKATSGLFYKLFRFLTGIDLPANAADFRLIDRKVVIAFRQIRERTRFLRGLTNWVGYRSIGIPYHAQARRAGITKYNIRHMTQFALNAILSFSTVPLYIGIFVGFIQAILGFGYTIFVLYARFVIEEVVPGWSSVIILISIVGGIQLMLMGIIGLYIGKIYEEIKQRPLYLIQQVLGFEGAGVIS
jgi:dolichol-phosphate mannosyltransferase